MAKKKSVPQEEINWTKLEPAKWATYDLDVLHVTIKKYQSDPKPKAKIRIGEGLCEKLGLVVGSKVAIFFNPDNIRHWKLAEASNGYKLASDGTKNVLTTNFTLTLGIEAMKKNVEYRANLKARTLEFNL